MSDVSMETIKSLIGALVLENAALRTQVQTLTMRVQSPVAGGSAPVSAEKEPTVVGDAPAPYPGSGGA